MERSARYPFRKRTYSQSNIDCAALPNSNGTSILSGPFKGTEFIDNVSNYLMKMSRTGDACSYSETTSIDKTDRNKQSRPASATYLTGGNRPSHRECSVNVLSGTKIIDLLYNYITVECSFRDAVDRSNAEKLASLLLKLKIVVPAAGKIDSGSMKFVASKHHLYRITCNTLAKETSNAKKRRQSVSVSEFVYQKTNSKCNLADEMHTKENIRHLRKDVPASETGVGTLHNVSMAECEKEQHTSFDFGNYEEGKRELIRHIALLKLLQVIDVSMLCDIISYVENNVVQSDYRIVSAQQCNIFDDALCNAMMELCSVLNLPAVFCGQKRPSAAYKLELCQLLFDHYKNSNESIFNDCFNVPLSCLRDLLHKFKDNDAERTFQLLTLLLPIYQQQHLKALLLFIHLAENDTAINLKGLDCQSNLDFLVESLFRTVFTINDELCKDDAKFLLHYFVQHSSSIGAIPKDIEMELEIRCKVGRGIDAFLYCPSTFCRQISNTEYERQKQQFANLALMKLTDAVIESSNFTLKQKKNFVKRLEKCHHDIYTKNFHRTF